MSSLVLETLDGFFVFQDRSGINILDAIKEHFMEPEYDKKVCIYSPLSETFRVSEISEINEQIERKLSLSALEIVSSYNNENEQSEKIETCDSVEDTIRL